MSGAIQTTSWMEGSKPPINWAVLAPHIEHPAREAIVESLRWVGSLSARDLKRILADPKFHLAYLAYHLAALVKGGAASTTMSCSCYWRTSASARGGVSRSA